MAKNERRDKIDVENRFYLELEHKYGGDFESILSPLELGLWNRFPDFHKRFFSLHQNWEFLAKESLKLFHQTERIGSGFSVSEQVFVMMQAYFNTCKLRETTLTVADLSNLLFPLLKFESKNFSQRIAEALYYHTDDPDEAKKRYSIEWQSGEALSYPIPFAWLQKQHDKYLQECAYVWHRYLEETVISQVIMKKNNDEYHLITEVRSNTKIQRNFILIGMPDHGIDPKAVERGQKAAYRRAFCAKYKISEAVFDDRWKELCKAGEVHSLHQPRKKSR